MNELEQTLSDEELLEGSANLRDKLFQITGKRFFVDEVRVMPYSAQEEKNEQAFSQYDANVLRNCLAYINANKNPEETFDTAFFDGTNESEQNTPIKTIISETKKVLEEHEYFLESQKPGFDNGIDPVTKKRTHFTEPDITGFDGLSAFYLMLATTITNQGLRKIQQTYKD